jgi:molecular chaperone Hsp33
MAPADDIVLPFHLSASGMSGRLLRLGAAIDTILAHHDYPEPAAYALGEAVGLAALFATGLKFDSRYSDGRFILQTKSDGPLPMLVAHFDRPGHLRAYARFDETRRAQVAEVGRGDQARLLGDGHLAMTIQPGGDLDQYQGITPLAGSTLIEAVSTYFRQSEQLPTVLKLAVARVHDGTRWSWRAGGIVLQYSPKAGGDARPLTPAEAEARDSSLYGEDDEDWTRTRLLAETVEAHELTDPTLTPERLLLRLFHEEGPRVLPAVPLDATCRCSRERLEALVSSFSPAERAEMRTASGTIDVTCEFCTTVYKFAA